MTKTFQYSILKYRPSYLLDERVIIGLIFHFKSDLGNKYIFTYPSELKRVSNFFPTLGNDNIANIEKYLQGFRTTADKLGSRLSSSEQLLKDVISSEFIVDDANSFFFSEIKYGSFDSIEQTVNYYEGQYFKFYENDNVKESQDLVVKAFFKKSLRELASKNDSRLKYFEEGVNIKNKITSSKFEFRWKNGTTNLVKTLGFDLFDKQDIQDKAFKWTSAINYISKTQEYSNYRFDILVSKPSDKNLLNAYEKALDVLNDINADKKIFQEEDIKQYAENALNTVQPFI